MLLQVSRLKVLQALNDIEISKVWGKWKKLDDARSELRLADLPWRPMRLPCPPVAFHDPPCAFHDLPCAFPAPFR